MRRLTPSSAATPPYETLSSSTSSIGLSLHDSRRELLAEVGIRHRLVLLHALWRAGRDDAAEVKSREPRSQTFMIQIQSVLDQGNRHLRAKGAQQVGELLDLGRCQPARGFVE